MPIKQPVTQKRLTNVAVVRLKSHGKKFEIACYKNKVVNWREGIEKDLAEVIQIDTIFTNVSKAIVANEKDLQLVFGTTNNEEICRKILKSGDLQVSDREREVQLEGLFRDIVQIVVERCIHPQSGRQMTALTVENALHSIGFSVQPDHTAKKQSLKAIEALCSGLPDSFARAKMRLRISCPAKLAEEIRTRIMGTARAQIEEECQHGGAQLVAITFLCDPSQYRDFDQLATSHAEEEVALQIITSAVSGEAGRTVCSVGASPPAEASSLSVLSVGSAPRVQPPPIATAAAAESEQSKAEEEPKKKGMRCSCCDAVFEDAAEYRKHCRSEWHNFNLKRKVKSLGPVSEEQFAEISLDTREGFVAVE